MITLGVILLIVGLIVPTVHVLVWFGLILCVVGLVLAAASIAGHGRHYW